MNDRHSPDEQAIHDRLTRAAARLPTQAPAETEVALRAVTAGRRRFPSHGGWSIAMAAATAAAASVAAVIVVNRGEGGREIPAAASPPSTLAAMPVMAGPPTDEDFDGDGGRCVGLAFGDTPLQGCFSGHLLRSDSTAYAIVDGQVVGVRPDLVGGVSVTVTELGDDAVACFQDLLEEGESPRLWVALGCVEGQTIVGRLSPDPTAPIEWSLDHAATGWEAVGLDAYPSSPDNVHVFTATIEPFPGWDHPRCVIVVTDEDHGSRRHACFEVSEGGNVIAGTNLRPVQVEVVAGGRVRDVQPLAHDSAFVSNGCVTPIGRILTSVDDPLAITELQCAAASPTLVGLAGSLLFPGVRVLQGYLELDVTTGEPTSTHLGGPDIECDPITDTCVALGLASGDRALPIPPSAIVEQLLEDIGVDHLAPVDVTERFADLDGECCPDALAEAVRSVLEQEMPDARFTVQMTSNPGVVVVDGVPDDGAARITYVIWTTKTPEMVKVGRAYSIVTCARGVVVDDGESLCV